MTFLLQRSQTPECYEFLGLFLGRKKHSNSLNKRKHMLCTKHYSETQISGE
jgi:hypothetical protein